MVLPDGAFILRLTDRCTEDAMKDDNAKLVRTNRVWLAEESCDLDEFRRIVERSVDGAVYPFASDVVANVPVYDGLKARSAAASPESRKDITAEWVEALTDGPGVIAIRGAFADMTAIDKANDHFWAIIEEERLNNVGGGDHFAKPGANDRIWNALEKLCLRDPATFAAYYGNAIIALVSEAWLGPAYHITSQLNVVNPGGAAQLPHRDYHLGFQSPQAIERYPAHVHRLSPVLTLQGAVAHCDMPVETGPTLYLPFSQTYMPGYLATGRAEFKDYFDKHHVQLPLAKGDAAFFNPALFHAAGTNRSKDVRRIANLLQVSSAYGRAMESVDRLKMSLALYPTLRRLAAERKIGQGAAANAIAACAEGYSFPTNLDRDPPLGGLAPQTQEALMTQALTENWEPEAFTKAAEAQARKKLT
jgi:ectoine hydroxylase-related dioxygenase (phytanoyl-CoA dioxygenase family)